MIKLSSLLNELIVSDLTTSKNNGMVWFIAYQDKLFLVDKNSKMDNIRKHLKGHPSLSSTYYSKFFDNDFNYVHRDLSRVAESSPDIIVGEYYPHEKAILIWNTTDILPKTSLMVKKIAKQLGVKKILRRFYVNDDYDTRKSYKPSQLVGGIPKIVYHGTNSIALKDILTYGLDPGRGTSKWSRNNIIHKSHIFFISEFEEAIFYAKNAVREDEEEGKYYNYPIIIELTIPDQSLIVPDFDADISTTSPEYYQGMRTSEPTTKTTMKSMGVSRETGRWGYKGRIPAKFIRWVYYYNDNQKKWHKSKPDVWRKLLDRYDWETIGYKLGMAP
jgi:hypothetical protein